MTSSTDGYSSPFLKHSEMGEAFPHLFLSKGNLYETRFSLASGSQVEDGLPTLLCVKIVQPLQQHSQIQLRYHSVIPSLINSSRASVFGRNRSMSSLQQQQCFGTSTTGTPTDPSPPGRPASRFCLGLRRSGKRDARGRWQMADIVSYAASLTSSISKVFDRETMVVNSRPLRKSACVPTKASLGNSGRNGGGSEMVRKRGKECALLASQQVREEKAQTKRNDVLRLWAEKCAEFEAEFENDMDLIMCYLKAQEFQNPRSPGSHAAVRPEVSLYLCNVLVKIWAHTRKDVGECSPEGQSLVPKVATARY